MVLSNIQTTINKNTHYLIDHYNPKLFLALAAMTEKGSYRNGEEYVWVNSKKEDLRKLKIVSSVGCVKPTKEELIAHFTKDTSKDLFIQQVEKNAESEIIEMKTYWLATVTAFTKKLNKPMYFTTSFSCKDSFFNNDQLQGFLKDNIPDKSVEFKCLNILFLRELTEEQYTIYNGN